MGELVANNRVLLRLSGSDLNLVQTELVQLDTIDSVELWEIH
jgi:hypothetical protein